MDAPGHKTILGERAAAAIGAPSTSNGFVIGFTQRGAIDRPIPVVSTADFLQKCGSLRDATTMAMYDGVETAFREGATLVYIAREAGTGAVAATKSLVDAEGKTVAVVTANSVGAWGNELDVVCVLSAGNMVVTVKYEGATVETSPSLGTIEEVISWFNTNSLYVTMAAGEKTTDAKSQTIELASGDDKHGSATITNFEAALALLTKDLGPGQVVAPLRTTEAEYKAIAAHCVANERRGLLDLVDGNESELVAASTPLRSLEGNGERLVYPMAQRAIVPGLTTGTSRTVSRACAQLGRIARCESEGLNPNKAAAGKNGGYRWVTGLSRVFTDPERAALNAAGVNCAILRRGKPVNYGDRTATNPVTDPNWKSFASSRLIMAVAAIADEVMEGYDFEDIDGHGYVFGKLKGDMESRACMPFYKQNALYGTTPDEAFQVNTGPDINTPTTISAEEIRCQVAVRSSNHGETLTTEVVKVPVSEAI
jgi:hypothetical protein